MTAFQGAELDTHRIRAHFDLASSGRIVTNNAASTQPPRQLLDLYRSLVPSYDNVHRGQSTASQRTTEMFEESYDTIAGWLNAPSRRSIATYRNTTEAHNAVMYSLLTEFRDGDNIVTTMMEHNSNFVPWYALCREILPRLGRNVECRVARFDHLTGELDLDHLASLVDSRTKLVCCTGASNFLALSRRCRASGRSWTTAAISSRTVSAGLGCSSTAPNWCPAATSMSRTLMSTTCRSPSTSSWHRSGLACCTPRSIC